MIAGTKFTSGITFYVKRDSKIFSQTLENRFKNTFADTKFTSGITFKVKRDSKIFPPTLENRFKNTFAGTKFTSGITFYVKRDSKIFSHTLENRYKNTFANFWVGFKNVFKHFANRINTSRCPRQSVAESRCGSLGSSESQI